MTDLRYGRIQLKIMQILWDRKRATVREITDELNKSESIVFRNVHTLLKTLVGKGVVDRDENKKSITYYPLVSREDGIRDSVELFLETMFHGSAGDLISAFIKDEDISPDEMLEILEMLEKEWKNNS